MTIVAYRKEGVMYIKPSTLEIVKGVSNELKYHIAYLSLIILALGLIVASAALAYKYSLPHCNDVPMDTSIRCRE